MQKQTDTNMGQNPSLIPVDPRVPLAAERTFLAWVRTGLALMGFGFAVARFRLLTDEASLAMPHAALAADDASLSLGILLVALGILLNLAALARYRRYLERLGRGIVPDAKTRLETVLAVALALLGTASLLYLILSAKLP
jgi:putative membrane protein